MEFFDIPLTRFAGTIADVSGVRAPEYCPKERVEEIKTLVRDTTGKDTVDKVVIYNPDALGAWYIDKYAETFKPVTSVCPLRVNYLTSYPPKTPVCFGTMFTGTGNILGFIVALIALIYIIYMLFRPYKEATTLKYGSVKGGR